MLKKLKSQKGIAWVDIEISFVVMIIFVALIGRMIYNIYYLRVLTQKQAVATAYQTQILEDIDAMEFKNVTGNLTEVEDGQGGKVHLPGERIHGDTGGNFHLRGQNGGRCRLHPGGGGQARGRSDI